MPLIELPDGGLILDEREVLKPIYELPQELLPQDESEHKEKAKVMIGDVNGDQND